MGNISYLRGGEFIIKDAAPETVFTVEEFNEEQQMVNSMASDFMEQEVMPLAMKLEKHEFDHSVTLMRKAGDLGLLGTAIPSEYGGMGQDVITGCIVAEQAGRTGAFATTFIAHVGIGTLPILYFGTEEQKKKYLPGLSSGEFIGSYCLTEPSSGSDALGAKTTATLSADGKSWILNGQKMWISNAGFADTFIVFAKIDGKEFTGFIVEKGTPGLQLGAEEDKMGIKGSSTRQVFFENCTIPVENMLGERGKGHKIAFYILNIGRYKLGATVNGGCKETFNNAVKYAIERTQFGQSISNFGAIKFKLSQMATLAFTNEALSYRVAKDIENEETALIESGKSHNEALLQAAEEYSIECAIAKVYGSDVLDYIVDEAVQIYGGMGFSEEAPVARAYRDSRIARIYEGTNEINSLLAIDMVFKKAMSGKLDLLSAGKAITKELMSVPDFSSGDDDNIFSEEEKALKNAKKALILVAGSAAKKLMANMKNEQMIIMNAARILIEIYAMESALIRVKKLAESRGAEAVVVHKSMLELLFNDCMAKINKEGKDALLSFADGDELNMMLLGLKRFTKYKNINVSKSRTLVADYFIKEGSYKI
jgi:alkylation response protein AidB-like acyl-CoA dehydrogenase